MKTNKTRLTTLVLFLSLAAGIILSGCSTTKTAVWGSKENGLILKYRMARDKSFMYKNDQNVKESMVVQGNNIDVMISQILDFTITPIETKEDLHSCNIRIDDLEINIDSPQGEINADVSDVKGKSFLFEISSSGKEINTSGAENIKYDLGQAGKRSIAHLFMNFFPDVAERPLKKGDTWLSIDTVEVKEGGSVMTLIINSDNTLEGYETVNDMDCAKIAAVLTGTMKAVTKNDNVEYTAGGDFSGDHVWYFAYKEGYFVKEELQGKVEGTVNVATQNLKIPMTREIGIRTNLISVSKK